MVGGPRTTGNTFNRVLVYFRDFFRNIHVNGQRLSFEPGVASVLFHFSCSTHFVESRRYNTLKLVPSKRDRTRFGLAPKKDELTKVSHLKYPPHRVRDRKKKKKNWLRLNAGD